MLRLPNRPILRSIRPLAREVATLDVAIPNDIQPQGAQRTSDLHRLITTLVISLIMFTFLVSVIRHYHPATTGPVPGKALYERLANLPIEAQTQVSNALGRDSVAYYAHAINGVHGLILPSTYA